MAANAIRRLLTLAGVDDVFSFNGEPQAQRLAPDLFDDSFLSCMNKSYDKIDRDLKSYSTLTVVQGQIQLQPGVKRAVKAFVQ